MTAETRTEWAVHFQRLKPDGRGMELPTTEERARAVLAECVEDGWNVKLVSRTITTTEWEEVS